MTFNGHRIHYDRPYATQEEGYPGLVVHGPLLATLLIHHFKQEYPDKQITHFEFRAVNPVFDFDDFQIYGSIKSDARRIMDSKRQWSNLHESKNFF